MRWMVTDLLARFSSGGRRDEMHVSAVPSMGVSGKWGGVATPPATADSTASDESPSPSPPAAAAPELPSPPPPLRAVSPPPSAPGASPLPRSHVSYPFSPSRTHVAPRRARGGFGMGGLGSGGQGRPGPLVLVGGDDPFADPHAAAPAAEPGGSPVGADTVADDPTLAQQSPFDSPLEPTSPPRSFASLITAPTGYRHVTTGGTASPPPTPMLALRPAVDDARDLGGVDTAVAGMQIQARNV